MIVVPGVPLAQAGTVIYTLEGMTNPGFGPVHSESFRFTAPDLITSMISLSAAELDSCVACIQPGTAVEFYPYGTVSIVIPVDYIRFTDADQKVYGFFFAPGALSAAGTYDTFDDLPYITSNVGTLTVQTAPEPSTSAMGVLGLLAALHFRRKQIHRGR
jgi:hypothetical protein